MRQRIDKSNVSFLFLKHIREVHEKQFKENIFVRKVKTFTYLTWQMKITLSRVYLCDHLFVRVTQDLIIYNTSISLESEWVLNPGELNRTVFRHSKGGLGAVDQSLLRRDWNIRVNSIDLDNFDVFAASLDICVNMLSFYTQFSYFLLGFSISLEVIYLLEIYKIWRIKMEIWLTFENKW